MEELKAGARKRGRPRMPRPTLPAFMGVARSWVKLQARISEATERELRRYIQWGSAAASVTEGEALGRTVDRALVDLMKRDRLWREERARRAAAEMGKGGT